MTKVMDLVCHGTLTTNWLRSFKKIVLLLSLICDIIKMKSILKSQIQDRDIELRMIEPLSTRRSR